MTPCFNEAAGIHRRKHQPEAITSRRRSGFNEAAGIHRRKLGGQGARAKELDRASMRPPEFTGGNLVGSGTSRCYRQGFNEAAGIHRRKLVMAPVAEQPPGSCFNEAAGIHRRKPAHHTQASWRS